MRRSFCLLVTVLIVGSPAAVWPQEKTADSRKKPARGFYAVQRESLKEKDVLPLKDGEVLLVHRHLYLKKDEKDPPRILVVRSAPDVELDLAGEPKAVKEGSEVVRIGAANYLLEQLQSARPPLTAAARAAIIEGVLKRLRDAYVCPDVARKMEQGVRERAGKGDYDGIARGEDLARDLTVHLREVSRDTHILVTYSREKRLKRPTNEPTADEQEKRRRRATDVNFGFKRVERLGGNVGYLEVEGFWRPSEAAETAAAAMTFLTNTDALIIDLRSNGGGNPGTVALLCSYFLGEEPIHLWDEHSRPDAVTCPVWSLPHVSGKRYLGKDVFLLTSRGTYSAAEGFAYTLKNLKRATVVGEATGGGAHPGDMQPVDEHFSVFVPTGRVVSPITKTDWEGTGVAPDVDVPARLALATAHLEALKRLAVRQKDDPEAAGQLAKIRQGVERELNDLKAHGTK